MNYKKHTINVLGAAVVAVLVTACGSGGTSKSSNQQTSAPPSTEPRDPNLKPVVLGHNNFSDIASQSLKSLLLNEAGTNALNKSIVITGERVNPLSQDVVTGIVVTINPFPCSNGGTIKGQVSAVNTNGGLVLDLGQDITGKLSAEFATCNHGGFGLDGDVNGSLTGNLYKNNFKSNINVLALKVQQPNFPEFVFDGDFSYEASSKDYVTVQIDVSSHNSLYFADQSYRLLDFTMSKTVNNNTGDYSYQIVSEFTDSTNSKAYVSYQTLTPLTGRGFSPPTGGQLAIEGDNGTVFVHAQEQGKLLLELDLNNDGSIDEVRNSTWDELVFSSLQPQ